MGNHAMKGLKGFGLLVLTGFMLLSSTVIPSAKAVSAVPDLPTELRSNNKAVLLDFYAEWCSTCKSMKPYIESLYHQYGTKLKLISIDIDNKNNQKYVRLYSIYGTPTYILFNPQGKALYKTEDSFNPETIKTQIIKATGPIKACTANNC